MPTLAAHGRLIRLTVLVFALFALAFLGGGGLLVWLGGSPYYLVAGLMLLATAWLLWRRPLHAFWLYIVLLAGTMVWSVIEVGLDGWQLVPRLDLWIVLGLWLALPWVPNRLSTTHGAVKLAREVTLLRIVLLLAAVLLVYGVFFRPAPGTLEGSLAETTAPGNQAAHFAPRDWSAYGHSGYGDRYAPLSQITPANVARLERAWEFHTGDFKGSGDPDEMANEVTPLKANGMLYICTPHNIVIALDPDTGRERWRFNPRINRDASHYQHMICRGVAYYDAAAYGRTAADSPAVSECPRRIYAPTADATLVAVNADTGQPCTRFGQRGVVDLKAGQGAIKRGALNPTSPPVVTNRILVASASVTDNDSTNEPSGVILGFDIDSGKLVWNWDSGNPDETTPLPPGRQYVRNSPNSWSVSSVDERLGLVYIPMGNQTPDIWGGNRKQPAERFSSSIVALDIASGKLRWVYQTVHHDLWDMDIGAQPTLVDLGRPEGRVPALVAPTKRGDVYVLDRRTGRLLVPAPERPVPQGAAKGDWTAPTQPFSVLSFAPEKPLRETDMWGSSPLDQLVCRIQFRRHRYEGIFTPPSVKGSLVYPGNYGVFDWGGVAIDPVRQVMIANPNYMAFRSRLIPREEGVERDNNGSEMGIQPMTGTPFGVILRPFLSPLGIPCQAPPWGYMAAVDLRTMKKIWMHRNGTIRDSAPLPVPVPLGVPSLGGPMVTAGGVAFMSATLDYYLRAYDVKTGRQLWRDRLPAGGQATPMSYVSERTGRQYVVVMAGGHGSLGTKLGDSLIAYALPAGQQR
ncbi:glucose/quinate/shikimate family membrane-bound PQQ-dependent dehydrogenase [Gulbenkiania mobilis]|uniref:Quinoprotein glucose dehydrogenase n=1 Tax=Gulbenkiania mobilis TaxID=397457 RepID=A0ABY2D0Z4_GULMO|nr:quinoprotein glucose dehydrogenase [Gulbenkiania mobilis]